MKYKKETIYPVNVGVKLSDDMAAALRGVAERADISLSAAVRRCVQKGLPAVQQSLRPSRRKGATVRKQAPASVPADSEK